MESCMYFGSVGRWPIVASSLNAGLSLTLYAHAHAHAHAHFSHSLSDKTLHTHTRPGQVARRVVLAERVRSIACGTCCFQDKAIQSPVPPASITILCPSCREPLLDLPLWTR